MYQEKNSRGELTTHQHELDRAIEIQMQFKLYFFIPEYFLTQIQQASPFDKRHS